MGRFYELSDISGPRGTQMSYTTRARPRPTDGAIADWASAKVFLRHPRDDPRRRSWLQIEKKTGHHDGKKERAPKEVPAPKPGRSLLLAQRRAVLSADLGRDRLEPSDQNQQRAEIPAKGRPRVGRRRVLTARRRAIGDRCREGSPRKRRPILHRRREAIPGTLRPMIDRRQEAIPGKLRPILHRRREAIPGTLRPMIDRRQEAIPGTLRPMVDRRQEAIPGTLRPILHRRREAIPGTLRPM